MSDTKKVSFKDRVLNGDFKNPVLKEEDRINTLKREIKEILKLNIPKKIMAHFMVHTFSDDEITPKIISSSQYINLAEAFKKYEYTVIEFMTDREEEIPKKLSYTLLKTDKQRRFMSMFLFLYALYEDGILQKFMV